MMSYTGNNCSLMGEIWTSASVHTGAGLQYLGSSHSWALRSCALSPTIRNSDSVGTGFLNMIVLNEVDCH